ncbi:MAG: T9SS type A sorting domain-containing protein [bacterium]|nr:T9SS type A sorting domain-containing protein [bacterium]
MPSGIHELKGGNSYFNRDNGSGRSRWGDYSGAWIDPRDSLSIWISIEYVEATNTWGTWIGSLKFNETVVEVTSDEDVIKSFELFQNYPNPFNPNTVISYQLSVISNVTLQVYDVLGNEVATLVNEEKPAGEYQVEFIPSSINHHPSSGIYFYQLRAGDFVQTKKMVLIK